MMSSGQDIHFQLLSGAGGYIGEIVLARVNQLNALTPSMVSQLKEHLLEWRTRSDIKAVVLRSASPKAFCAGGDVRQLAQWGKHEPEKALRFLEEEYQINHLISTYPIPYISLMDGIVMGGGVGISIHGPYRVASERCVWSMPETAIGFFPDIGATYFLSRCPRRSGAYLGLTGARLNAREARELGLHTHLIPSDRFHDLLEQLVRTDPDLVGNRWVHDVLFGLEQPFELENQIQPLLSWFEKLFVKDSLEAVVVALEPPADTELEETARIKILNMMRECSPTSMKIFYEQFKRGLSLDLWTCLTQEFCIAQHLFQKPDFYEGVRARLIDKDQKPQWNPSHLKDISDQEIQLCFEPINSRILQPLPEYI